MKGTNELETLTEDEAVREVLTIEAEAYRKTALVNELRSRAMVALQLIAIKSDKIPNWKLANLSELIRQEPPELRKRRKNAKKIEYNYEKQYQALKNMVENLEEVA